MIYKYREAKQKMSNAWKIIHMVGDVIFIIWPCVMIVAGKSSFDDYITLGGLLILGVLDLIRNIRKL